MSLVQGTGNCRVRVRSPVVCRGRGVGTLDGRWKTKRLSLGVPRQYSLVFDHGDSPFSLGWRGIPTVPGDCGGEGPWTHPRGREVRGILPPADLGSPEDTGQGSGLGDRPSPRSGPHRRWLEASLSL